MDGGSRHEISNQTSINHSILLQLDLDNRGFVATCPSLPGCVSQGDTREEAIENIREAIQAWIESHRKHGDPIPPVGELLEVDVDIEPDA